MTQSDTAFAEPHPYSFDPGYGYTLKQLMQVQPPSVPSDFAAFWSARYEKALKLHPRPRLMHTGGAFEGYEVYDLEYTSTDSFIISGWALIPQQQPVVRGLVVGHGYAGRDQPDYHLKFPGAALLFPCFRGLAKSQHPSISADPSFHVLHNIHSPDRYLLGGCVDDLWLAVSALLFLFPAVKDHIGYLGLSFGGGIGALAAPWDPRINRVHLNVPTFGHNPLRMALPTEGSAKAVQQMIADSGHIDETLSYYDAAISALFGNQPLHVAAAGFDPMVAPPGQFAIFNAWKGDKELMVLDAGHFDYPGKPQQDETLLDQLMIFFDEL